MIETKVMCDGCKEEIITTTSYMAEAYVELNPVFKNNPGSSSFATYGRIPIKKSYQFHDLECVGLFVND